MEYKTVDTAHNGQDEKCLVRLDSKVCQSCLESYQKTEAVQRELIQAQRKIERLENQHQSQR